MFQLQQAQSSLFSFAYLIFAHCLAKPESPSKCKNTLSLPSPSLRDRTPSCPPPNSHHSQGKNKGLRKVPPSTPWPGCSPCRAETPSPPHLLTPPRPHPHRACQQLQSPAAARGRQKAFAQHVSFCRSLPGRKMHLLF